MSVVTRRAEPEPPAVIAAEMDSGAWLERHAAAVALVLIAGNLMLKLPLVGAQGIWFDEAVTMQSAQAPFDLVRSLSGDATPPLYTILLHAWMYVFGTSLEAARVLSVLLSSATAALLFQLGRRFLDPTSGLYAALLFTVSRYQLHYGHEARPYALVGLLCAASFYALLALLERPTRRKAILLAVLDAALLYTHYVSAVAFAAQVCAALVPRERARRNVSIVLASQALALLLFVPWVLRILAAWPLPMAGWLTTPGPRQAYDLMVGYAGSELLLAIEALLLCGALVVALVARSGRAANGMAWRLAAWAFLPLVLAYAASYVEPIFLDRYLLYASLGLFLLIAWAVVRLPVAPVLRHALVLGLCALSLVHAEANPIQRADWRGAAVQVREATQGGALTVVAPSHQLLPLSYHLVPESFRDQDHLVEALQAKNVLALPDLSSALQIHGANDVLAVLTDTTLLLHPDFPTRMEQGGFRLERRDDLTGIVLLRFARS